MALVIMAAGLGSRYKGLKQLEGVGPQGEFLMDYSISAAVHAGIKEIVVIVRRDFLEICQEMLGSRWGKKVALKFVIQDLEALPAGFKCPQTRKSPWGTAHAVLAAKNAISGNFAIINADDFYGLDTFQLIARFLQKTSTNQASGAMVSYELAKTTSHFGAVTRGICRVEDNILVAIKEQGGIYHNNEGVFCLNEAGDKIFLDPKTRVSMNFWGFTPVIMAYLDQLFVDFLNVHLDAEKTEFLLPEAINTLVKQNRLSVEVMESDSVWFGMTYPEDRESVKKHLLGVHQSFF